MRVFTFLLMALLFPAIPSQALTLDEVISAVRSSHPDIARARYDAKSAAYDVTAGSFLPDPKVGVMWEETPLSGGGLKQADMKTYSVAQDVPFPTVLSAQKQALKNEARARRDTVTTTERQKIFEAKSAYYALIAVRNQIAEKNGIIASYGQGINSLTKVYESGAATGTSDPVAMNSAGTMGGNSVNGVLMAKMQKAEVEVEIHDLHHQDEALSAQINLMMGRSSDAPLGKLQMPPLKRLRLDDKILENKLMTQNSDLSTLHWMAEKAKFETRLAKQSFIPMVTPEFEYNQRLGRGNAYSLGMTLNVPVWGFRNVAQIKSAKARELRSRADYESGKLGAQTELHNLIAHARMHMQILSEYRGNILPLAKSLVNTAISSLAANRGAAELALQKLADYDRASAAYWQAWSDYQNEYALLEALIGEDL